MISGYIEKASLIATVLPPPGQIIDNRRPGRGNGGWRILSIFSICRKLSIIIAPACRIAATKILALPARELVWVLTANPHRGFYERLGGEAVRARDIEWVGASIPQTGYGWLDLSELSSDHAPKEQD